jgi:hypothetical protein
LGLEISGQTVLEIRIEGTEQAEELRELIRSLVRQPVLVVAGLAGTGPLTGSTGDDRPQHLRQAG